MKKALIADDDPFMVDRYAAELRKNGFSVRHASDGRTALHEIRAGGYDLVLLDIVLPLMDGFEVLGALERKAIVHPPIILLSNLGQRADIERGFLLGAADYFVKARHTPQDIAAKAVEVLGRPSARRMALRN